MKNKSIIFLSMVTIGHVQAYEVFGDRVYGIRVPSTSRENSIKLENTDRTISSEDDNVWVYGISASSTSGENSIKLKNINMTTNSHYVAKGIEIGEGNLGKNNFELENVSINTNGKFPEGINIEDNYGNNSSGENTINFKKKNTICSKGMDEVYGINIKKRALNTGNGTTITSDKDSTIDINISSERYGVAIKQWHIEGVNKTETTFNGDVYITWGPTGTKRGVFNYTQIDAPNDSKSTISFNKGLVIKGDRYAYSLFSTGNKAEINVAGNGDVKLIGNISASNKGKVTLNLLNKNSYLKGDSDNYKGTFNMKMANSSYWLITRDSEVNDLDISSGAKIQISDMYINDYYEKYIFKLSIDNLKGTGGIFQMQGDVQTGIQSLLTINERSEGDHYIEFENKAGAKSTGTEYLKVVESLGEEANYTATFKLKNPNGRVGIPIDATASLNNKAFIERGAYLYTLGRPTDSKVVSINDSNVNNWYLFPYEDDGKGKLTPGAESSLSFSNTIYQINLLNTETLVQRLGEIHFDKTDLKPHNAWIKHVNGKYTSFANDTIGSFSTHYWGIKAGFDWLNLRNNWINYNGISVENLNASTYPKRFEGKTKISGKGIGIYSTWLNKNNDIYIDLVGKMMRYKGKYDIVNYSNENIKSNNANINSYLLSIETGKRSYFLQKKEKAFYIQPEMQLIYQFVDDYTLHSSNGLKSMTKNSNSLIGRIGFRAGLDFYGDSVLSPYIKFMYNKEFLGSVVNDLNTAKIEMNNKDDWFNYGVGISHENKKKGRQIYLDVQRSNKHLIRQDWQVNLGLRYSF